MGASGVRSCWVASNIAIAWWMFSWTIASIICARSTFNCQGLTISMMTGYSEKLPTKCGPSGRNRIAIRNVRSFTKANTTGWDRLSSMSADLILWYSTARCRSGVGARDWNQVPGNSNDISKSITIPAIVRGGAVREVAEPCTRGGDCLSTLSTFACRLVNSANNSEMATSESVSRVKAHNTRGESRVSTSSVSVARLTASSSSFFCVKNRAAFSFRNRT